MPDILGGSAVVDVINHRNPAGATDSTVLGPFHVTGSPLLPLWGSIADGVAGTPAFVSGKVMDTQGRPVEGVVLDFWQTDGVKGC